MNPGITSKNLIVVCIFIVISVSGCLYIPPIGQQSKEEYEKDLSDITNLEIGTITRDQVLERFGKETEATVDRFLLYSLSHSQGGLLLIGTIGADFFGLGGEGQLILLEFDENEILKRKEVEVIKAAAFENTPKTVPTSEYIQEFENTRILAKRTWLETVKGYGDVSFSPDGNLVAYRNSDDKYVLQNLATEEKSILKPESSWLCPTGSSLRFFPDSRLLAYEADSVNVYNIDTQQTVTTYTGHGECSFFELHMPTAMAIAPDGTVIASGDLDGYIKIWDPLSGTEIKSIKAHNKQVLSLDFSPDGRLLATVGIDENDNANLVIFDLAGKYEQVSKKQDAGIVKFSPDGKVLAIHNGIWVELWEVDTNVLQQPAGNNLLSRLIDIFIVPIFITTFPGTGTNGLEFSPAGNMVAASSGGMVIYNLDTLDYEIRYLPVEISDTVTDLAFSTDSKSLLIAYGEGVLMWAIPGKE